MSGCPLILASGSPRRREMLRGTGVKFETVVPDIDETVAAGESPQAAAERLACEKAQIICELHPSSFVLAADTVVAVSTPSGETVMLAKPESDAEAKEMLRLLQGRVHLVCTGFCLRCAEKDFAVSRVANTDVWMKPMSDSEIAAYVRTGESRDKAGAYAIQAHGLRLIERINGSYTNVVGLPLVEVLDELARAGLFDLCSFPN